MKNKGFTLIEVLAVLLILAIIALITVPIISNIIRESKETVFVQDVNSLVESIRTYQADNNYEAITINYTTGENVELLELDGDLPDSGQIAINEAGKVEVALWNEELQICATKSLNDKEVVKEEITQAQCAL